MGFFDKIKAGLKKTRENISSQIHFDAARLHENRRGAVRGAGGTARHGGRWREHGGAHLRYAARPRQGSAA